MIEGTDRTDSATSSHDGESRLIEAEKRMLALLAEGASLQTVLEVLCNTIEKFLQRDVLTSVLLLDGGHLRHGAAPSLPAAYNQAIDGIAIGPSVGSCGTAAFRRELVVVEDIAHDPLWAAFVDLATQHGLRACWSMPIEGHGKILGTFALYYRQPRRPTGDDLRLVQRVALIARVAIERHALDRERTALIEQARSAQREAEIERANLRDFIRDAPAILCKLRGPTHIHEIANTAYMQLVGGRPLIGKAIREAVPELAGQGFYELLDRVYTTGEPFIGTELPADVVDASGRPRHRFFNFVDQPTRNSEGAVDGIVVYAHDVTALVEARRAVDAALQKEKEARAAAEASQAQFRTLFDSMPQLGWTSTPDGFIDFYNAGWYEYTGTNHEQMQGWGWRSVHDPDMLPVVLKRWQHSLLTGMPFEMEFPLRRHDGVFRWFLTRVNPIRDNSGNIVRWVGINTDIDDIRAARALSDEMAEQSRQTEEMLVQLRAAKEEAERRLAECLRGHKG